MPPGFDLSASVIATGVPVLVQAFVPEVAVETLDVGVLDRLAGPDEVQRDAALVGPDVGRLSVNSGPLSMTPNVRFAAMTQGKSRMR
jgi:hypothetical protein